MPRSFRRLACLSATAALANWAGADLITWGAPQNVTSASDVRTNGTLVAARNPWASTSNFSPTVNGVTFAAFAPTGWTNGGWTLLNGSTTGDTEYDTLLADARATNEAVLTNPTPVGGIRIDNLGVLTLGKQYEIQVWYSDQRPGSPTNVLNDRQMIFGSATGVATLTGGIVTNLASLSVGASNVTLEADPNNVYGVGDTVFGQYAVGTFTRTSADQIWLLVQGVHPLSSNVLRPHINAFQIRELPPILSYCSAGTTTNGCNATISGAGTPSATAGSGFTVAVSGAEGAQTGILFYGLTQVSVPWGSGTSFLCVKAPLERMGVQTMGGNFGQCDGAMSVDWNSYIATTPTAVGNPFSAGATVYAQGWFRDPPAPKTTSLSDALQFTVQP